MWEGGLVREEEERDLSLARDCLWASSGSSMSLDLASGQLAGSS